MIEWSVQNCLISDTIFLQMVHYLVCTPLPVSLGVSKHTHPHFPTESGTEHAILSLHFYPPILFPSHSEQANTWCIYLDSCWLEVDVPSNRNSRATVPVTDSKAGGCQVNWPNAKS